MLVYIIPETGKPVKVKLIKVIDDMANIESEDILNPNTNECKRTVYLYTLYTLSNFYFNK